MNDKKTQTLLGQDVEYLDHYAPELLFAIERQSSRDKLGIAPGQLPFQGVDIWNAYELSWLNSRGMPQVAIAEFRLPCESPAIVESKSFKLYLNSFNQTRLTNRQQLQQMLIDDLSSCAGAPVAVLIKDVDDGCYQSLSGQSLDQLDIEIDSYNPDSGLLSASGELVTEALYSDLLRSLCPVTGQPDWASVSVQYRGPKIDKAGLLRYLVGYRQHQDYHEQCVERIFCDILAQCQPLELSVYARYVRRGGLDINPFRSNMKTSVENNRLFRQ
ncbi:MAG: 7-cyano-7-deazaguanine reductase [Oceanicoccus sp.]|jgi:7-cyano-7-deazaguanine reductase